MDQGHKSKVRLKVSVSLAIKFTSVSKKYKLDRHKSRSVQDFLSRGFRRTKTDRHEFWVLKDISFLIERGESVALVGANGAGKSTILKLISCVIVPTRGSIEVNGRVSSLLELGTGFHPDLTGRENIYLNGSLLGLSRREIDRKYADIVDFSELADFIDLPVKHYSSGMYLRLGFAIAIYTEPDILLIDEAIAVGDQYFQQRCLERIGSLKRRGITFLFVSHNSGPILNLCERAIWLKDGQIEADDQANIVLDSYQKVVNERYYKKQILEQQASSQPDNRWGSLEAEITRVELLNAKDETPDYFHTGETMRLRIHYTAHRRIEMPAFGLAFYQQDGLQLNGPNSVRDGYQISAIDGPGYVDYLIDSLPFTAGRYELTVAIYDHYSTSAFDHHHRMYTLKVRSPAAWQEAGIVHIDAQWRHHGQIAQPETSSIISNA